MGWGRTNNNRFDAGDRFMGGAHSNVLQKLKVPFITNELCRTNYTAFNNITTNKQICAGGEASKLHNLLPRGQLISKSPFGVFNSTKKKHNFL